MTTATLDRDGTTVEIELLTDSSGTPLVSRDFGKPNLQIQETGSINPRFIDAWSGLEQYTITGKFIDSNAYTDAISLMDLIKSNSDGNQLTLNIDMPEFDSNINVCPSAGQDAAASVSYNPGWKDYIEVDVALTRAETIAGGDQPATTPTTSGSGPIQITDGSTTVDLEKDITITRSVGRPQSTVRRRPDSIIPNHIDKFKTASDTFELSLEFTENAISKVNDIVSIFNQQLSRSPLTLDFNGVYGMGEFSVIPDGSQALRHTRLSGENQTGSIPTINLKRVI
jgi:hypothetical protein